MARKSKRDWLLEGVQMIAALGADHLTIDALTQRMGVTKGSFYHHFANYDAFIEAILAFWEEEGALNIIQHLEKLPTAHERLVRLLDITTADPYAEEIAFRAWALQNPLVKVVQTRIDEERIGYVQSLCHEIIHDSERANRMAQLLYLTYVGGQQIGLDRQAIQTLYREIMQLYMEST